MNYNEAVNLKKKVESKIIGKALVGERLISHVVVAKAGKIFEMLGWIVANDVANENAIPLKNDGSNDYAVFVFNNPGAWGDSFYLFLQLEEFLKDNPIIII
jgi:hypothetical protein